MPLVFKIRRPSWLRWPPWRSRLVRPSVDVVEVDLSSPTPILRAETMDGMIAMMGNLGKERAPTAPGYARYRCPKCGHDLVVEERRPIAAADVIRSRRDRK